MALTSRLLIIFAAGLGVSCGMYRPNQHFLFKCPTAHIISQIASAYNPSIKDRLWDIHCEKNPLGIPASVCSWSGVLYRPTLPITFQCERNGFIAGMGSEFNPVTWDRSFQFLCCKIHRTISKVFCGFGGYLNNATKLLDFRVPPGKFLMGVHSIYDTASRTAYIEKKVNGLELGCWLTVTIARNESNRPGPLEMAKRTRIIEKRLRFLYVCWAVLETMLFGGLMNGWASLVFVLKEDGLYTDLCPAAEDHNSSTGLPANNVSRPHSAICTEQDAMLNLWFSIAAGLRNIFGIVIGLVVFKFGTRVARLLGWFLFNAGALMMAFSDNTVPWLVLPSLLALSYGGGTLLLTNVQLSSLFPRAPGIVVTLISGAVDFSATTQLIVKVLREVGIPRKTSYIGITLAHACMAMISTMFFLPKKLYTRRLSIFQFGGHDIDLERLNEITRRALAGNESSQQDDDNDDNQSGQTANCQPGLVSGRGFEESLKGNQDQNTNTFYDEISNEENPFHTENSSRQGQHSQGDVILDAQKLAKTVEACCLTSAEGGPNGSMGGVKMVKDSVTELRLGRTCSFEKFGSARQRADCLTFDGLYENPSLSSPSGLHQTTGSKTHISVIQVSYTNHAVTSDDEKEKNTTEVLPCSSDDGLPSTTQAVKPHGHAHLVLPGLSIEARDTEDREADRSSCSTERPPSGPPCEQSNLELYPTLRSCLTSPVFVLHVMWTSFNVLRLVAFFGLINSKLSTMFDGDTQKVSFFTNVLAYFMLSMMFVCWISGAVYDWQTAVFRERQSLYQKRVLPGALPLAMTSAIGVAISAMALTDSERVLYLMFACFVFYNAFIFGVCLSFLMRVFPEKFFGILNGVLSIVSGSFCFLQYGIFRWHDINPEGPTHANIFMLSLVATSFLHPLYLVVTCLHQQTVSMDTH